MKGFITRSFRRRKRRKLSTFLDEYDFVLEYMKNLDMYCGSFTEESVRYGTVIGSNIIWFDGDMSVKDIERVIKYRYDHNIYYEEPTFYKRGAYL